MFNREVSVCISYSIYSGFILLDFVRQHDYMFPGLKRTFANLFNTTSLNKQTNKQTDVCRVAGGGIQNEQQVRVWSSK